MRIALLQINSIVGDLQGNRNKIIHAVQAAANLGAQLCIAPEIVLIGYPPRDLLLFTKLIHDSKKIAEDIAKQLYMGPALIMGTVDFVNRSSSNKLHNCAVVLSRGEIINTYAKRLLPTHDVFDEKRYFEPGDKPCVVEIGTKRLVLTVCEDIWNDGEFWPRQNYVNDPLKELPSLNADILINISASPFAIGKQNLRESMLSAISSKFQIPVLYANQVGGNDELVFDGRSACFDANGQLRARGKSFEEDIILFDTNSCHGIVEHDDFTPESEALRALVLGTKDYFDKTHFTQALLGLSGGIDSALTAAIACEALGPENVLGVLMPSPYSSAHSLTDANQLAKNLGMETITIPIEPGMTAFDQMLAEAFRGYQPDVTEENIQARLRGNILMALSNKYNALLLSTGNKSELAVGYCTIYGDMSGGLAIISDVPKTLVYRICNWINAQYGKLIPGSILTKPPSAELRPNQVDQDSLPPYEILDILLEMLIEKRMSIDEVVAAGNSRSVVQNIAKLVAKSEFKRRQAAPGLKISPCAFGVGWKMPIAAKYSMF